MKLPKTMNIYAKTGDEVLVSELSAKQGTDDDSIKIAKYLQIGSIYKVHHTIVHDWRTDVVLIGIPEIRFNSVNFEDNG